MIRHDLAVVQVQHRRQIQFFSGHLELGHVRYPFLVGPFGGELAFQFIRRDAAGLATIGLVLFHAHRAFQVQLVHQPSHHFTVNYLAGVAQGCGHSPVAVAPFMLALDALDQGFQRGERVPGSDGLELVVVGAAAQSDQVEQGR